VTRVERRAHDKIPPVQLPDWQVSVRVQASLSLQSVPSGFLGSEHSPVPVAQIRHRGTHPTPRTRPGVPLAQMPSWQFVGDGASATVVARRPVRVRGVPACAGLRVAHTGDVAGIARHAHHGTRADAGAGLAGIDLGASVAVIAARPVGLGRVRNTARSRCCKRPRRGRLKGRAHDGVVAPRRFPPDSDPCASRASPSLQAAPSVVAGLEQIPVAVSQTPGSWHGSEAEHTTAAPLGAGAGFARVRHRARIAVGTRRTIAFDGLEHAPVSGSHEPTRWHWSLAKQTTALDPTQTPARHVSVGVQRLPSLQGVPSASSGLVARTGPGIAHTHVVALVGRAAHHRIRPRANAGLARIRTRAGVSRRRKACRSQPSDPRSPPLS